MKTSGGVVQCSLKPLLATVCVGLMLVGCAGREPVMPGVEDMEPVSAVSVAKPGFTLQPGETVTWRTEILWIGGDDSPAAYRGALTQLDIRREVERQLAGMGLMFVAQPQADYAIVGAVMIGETVDGPAFEELARLYPSLASVSLTLETGTLMLALSHPSSPVILWRGSVLTFISPDLPKPERETRLQSVVRSLLNTIPRG